MSRCEVCGAIAMSRCRECRVPICDAECIAVHQVDHRRYTFTTATEGAPRPRRPSIA